ncbi:c-type cytochrome [Candidatus Vondammii sp. HM_W22]|uniref:c-type cytochrome n=1 Tax=Candidatus Vondammii sp. HM_W22 TaxID=2687299 RepID=UPI001F12F5AC|nr:cytochrome c [Candidatus Vondammii sp. HM_W22]
MSLKFFSVLNGVVVTAAFIASGQVVAEVRADVVGRIKPVGQVSIKSQAQAAAPVAMAEAPKVEAVVPVAAATAPTSGAAIYQAKGCSACHGADGNTPIMSTYPKLSGLPAPYIVNQMKDIKSGARNSGQAIVMKGIMAAVSDDDMKVIADWLTGL